LRHPGDFNDAVTNRLHAAGGQRKAHAASINKGLRNHGGFGDFDPNARFQSGEPFSRRLSIVVGGGLTDGVHSRRVDSISALEVGHLLLEVAGREPGKISRFGMTMA
jgi:hypothetical protein